eukprot:5381767-Heterocapsa_arctica.AAC.1
MSGADHWVGVFGAPSTASPSEMHSSLVISGSEGHKTGSAGSEGSNKPANPVLRAAPVKAAPVLIEDRAAASDVVQNTAEATK